jgi:lipid-A-disaccharide synthase-like uncharacterized protein
MILMGDYPVSMSDAMFVIKDDLGLFIIVKKIWLKYLKT